MKLFFFILLFIASNISISQSAGYMGRKFVAGYGLYYSPYLFGPDDEVSANTIHEGFVDYALWKRVSLGASVRYFHSISPNRCYAGGHVSTTSNYLTKD